jgi:hypothetical protein
VGDVCAVPLAFDAGTVDCEAKLVSLLWLGDRPVVRCEWTEVPPTAVFGDNAILPCLARIVLSEDKESIDLEKSTIIMDEYLISSSVHIGLELNLTLVLCQT